MEGNQPDFPGEGKRRGEREKKEQIKKENTDLEKAPSGNACAIIKLMRRKVTNINV